MYIIRRFGYSFVCISPVSISATAKLNSRILWGCLNMDGFLRSTIQNNKLNTKEAAAITPNKTRIVMSRLLRGGGFRLAVDEGEDVVLSSMLSQLKSKPTANEVCKLQLEYMSTPF